MSIKKELIDYCKNYIEERIQTATDAIAEARNSSANETKSSAGDKYETSREMLQGVIEQHTRQLQEAKRLKENLQVILDSTRSESLLAGAGSVVLTNAGNFFLSIPAGFTEVQGNRYALISISSPIGKLLLEKSIGNTLAFNGQEYKITSIIN